MSRWLVVGLFCLCACSSIEEFALRNVPEGPSTAWRYGYADGCWSGRHDYGSRKERQRDVARYRADDQYRSGWDTGYHDCFERAHNEAATTPTPVAVAVEGAPAEETPEPTLAVSEPAVPSPMPASSVARRVEIEARMRALRGELQSLQQELDALPR